MIVATYDHSNNQQIDSTVKSLGFELQKINGWQEITTNKVVFCLDKQAVQELSNLYFTNDIDTFRHMSDATYVFGKNNQKMAKEVISATNSGMEVHLVTISGKTLWAESAMAIILYNYTKR